MRSVRVFLLLVAMPVPGSVSAGAQEVSAHLASCGSASGELVCVCGWFEDLTGTGVLIDGQPAGPPVSASRNMLCFKPPPGPHRVSGDPARFSRVEGHEASVLEVRRTQTARTMERGMVSSATWTVTGTSEMVWLELRNRTPWIADLAGGNVQRVMTSGGPVNAVTRALTARGVGSVRLSARVVDGPGGSAGEEIPSPRELARQALVQQMFQLGLKAASQRFEEGVRDLAATGGGRLYRREDVARLFERTRDDVLRSLPAPELAAFRDSVEDFFAGALSDLRGLPPQTALSAVPGIRLAALQKGEAAHVETNGVESFFAKIRTIFALGDEPAVRTLCVRTTPENQAAALLYPRSYPADRQETATTAVLHLFIGKYRYEVRKQGFKAIENAVDLIWNPQPVLDCSLIRLRKRGDAVPCRLIPAAKDCPLP
ncbi:MAG TPA: hypothetical protein VH394_02850 [Thermoanaerobaculia bacterium]|jgi:hypothetical protein|nr:hypothetical protein [Thermoanaerobaculia bacterium]